MRKTKIIGTIGPTSNSKEVLKEMILAGLDVARFNFSHTNWLEVESTINTLKTLRRELNKPVAIMLDMQGPEIRLGIVQDKVELKKDNLFILKNDDCIGNEKEASISYKNLYLDVRVGITILIDDGLIKLKVEEIEDTDIICRVLNGGIISSYKSVNVPEVKLNLPNLTSKDLEDIDGAIRNDIDYIAASFVRRKEDILEIKEILNKTNIKVIAKIENNEGLNNFEEILEVADGIMVARGDLGVEIPFSKVPIAQKKMIDATIKMGKPVITATQMLESMIKNERPTRAEVSDVANAVIDGTSALMLSAETATGMYPVECIKTMSRIATDVEDSLDYWNLFKSREIRKDNFEFIINHALLTPAKDLNVKAIFAYSKTGDTPRILASLRPECPIYVITSEEKIFNQLALVWGINVFLGNIKEPKEMIMDLIKKCEEDNLISKGDIILIAGGKYIPLDEKEVNKNVGGIYQI